MTEAISSLRTAETALAELGPLPFPLPLGGAAAAVAGAVLGMKKGDWLVTGPRERVGAALRGCRVARLVDPRSGARPYKLAPVSAAPGNRALHAVGLAMVSGPTLCLLGAASTASGAFHEALNLAAATGAPVVFVVRQPALGDAPVARQLAASPLALAAAAGLEANAVTDDEDAVREAVSDARESGTPTLLLVR